MKAHALANLDSALSSLHKSIANFPVGAISIHDYKPTEEKIRDIRESLVALNAKILALRTKVEPQISLDALNEIDNDLYAELQDRIAHCTINKLVIASCLQASEIQEVLENSEDNEISRTLRIIMQKLFNLNDLVMNSEGTRAQESIKELQLKCKLQKSLSEFRDVLMHQESIRKEKLKETNPKIAQQKESIDRRLQKINIMKRLITNICATSTNVINTPEIKELSRKHRELLNIETVQEMARETSPEDS